MDHDTYSANDAIGKVNISLNPLLHPNLDASIQPNQSGKGEIIVQNTHLCPNCNCFYFWIAARFGDVRLDSSIRYHARHSWRSQFNC